MPIRTAIIGYGRSGSTLHADPIEKVKDFEMVSVCDINPVALDKACKRFGCRVYEDYTEMISKEALDLAVIVTRSDQHCKMASDCLNAGINVLVTKPWALNSNEAGKMAAASRESRKLLLPWLPAQWGCDLLRLKEIISTGIIGKIFMVRRSEHTFSIRNDWQTLKKYGGGYLLNWGPHLVGQPMQLLGTKVKLAYGRMKQVINPGDAEDVYFAVLQMEDDVTVVSEFNIASDYLPNWVIQGDRGTIYVKNTSIEIHRYSIPDDIGPIEFRYEPESEIIKEEIDGSSNISMQNRYGDPMVIYPEIASAIRGESTFPVSIESALHLTDVLDAIRKSHIENKAVIINT